MYLRRLRGLWARMPVRLRRLGGESGNAMIELAVVASFLGVPMFLGTAETGLLVYDSIEVSNAANAGASYAMQSLTYAANTTGITAAARADATDFGTALTASSSTYYVCSLSEGGTQYTGTNAQANATAACTGTSNHALEFVQVSTSATVTPPIHCPGLPTSFTLRGYSVMEVEQ